VDFVDPCACDTHVVDLAVIVPYASVRQAIENAFRQVVNVTPPHVWHVRNDDDGAWAGDVPASSLCLRFMDGKFHPRSADLADNHSTTECAVETVDAWRVRQHEVHRLS
jgi:hypothetical protein